MKKFLIFLLTVVSLLGIPAFAADVDYSIPNYDGQLVIHEDNTADFRQTITYHFDSSYNGQIVTLGEAGKVPKNFTINSQPQIQAFTNGKKRTVSTSVRDLGDGYELKIYNGGVDGDTVKIVVDWKISNILFAYQDVAELNWIPISDWDQTLEHVHFTVKTDRAAKDSRLWAHRGYLSPAVTLHKNGQTYSLSAKNVGSKLELHAYWDASILTGQNAIAQNHKATILNLEANIVKYNRWQLNFFYTILPATLIALVLISYLLFLAFKKNVARYSQFDFDKRLYEVPQDLSPLVLADAVYGANLLDSDTSGNPIKQKLSFENLMQATLLDLIDRKIIRVEKEGQISSLSLNSQDKALPFEKEVIKMAFGSRTSLPIDDLFADYQFDEDTIEQYKKTYHGRDLERRLNKIGSDFNRKYNRAVSNITHEVKNEVEQLRLPQRMRRLSRAEKGSLNMIQILTGLSFLIALVAGFYMIIKEQFALMIYLLLAIFFFLILLFYHRQLSFFRKSGVYTAEGQAYCQEWVSFTNMMRDLRKFDQVDPDALIVWNRILVYATLFGYAKRVQDYLEFNEIKLADDLSLDTLNQIAFIIGTRSHYLTTASSSATMASNFSISSGGSAGGGFSGGGGGGGGGAF